MGPSEDVGISVGVFNDGMEAAMWAARRGHSNSDSIRFVTYVSGRGYLGWTEYYGGLMLDYLAETRN